MKLNSFLFKISLACLIIKLTSCAPAYIPNTFNAPLIKSKNEVNASAYLGTNGLDGQVSAGIVKHLAIMCDYSYTNRSKTGIDSTGFRKHDFFEGALGFYHNPENKKICIEAWAGYGNGNSAVKADKGGLFNSKGDVVVGTYSRYFVQADFGYRNKVVETGVAVRGSYVNFSNLTNVRTNITRNSLDNWYVEPAGFVRVGGKSIKFSFQIGASIRVTNLDQTPRFTNQPFYCSVGLHLTLNRKWEDTVSK
jgi:hypothetical protein